MPVNALKEQQKTRQTSKEIKIINFKINNHHFKTAVKFYYFNIYLTLKILTVLLIFIKMDNY